MAEYTIDDLTALTGLASGDYVPVWDVSTSGTRKATITNLFAACFTQANTFTYGQTIQPSLTAQNGLSVYMPVGTSGTALVVQYNSANSARLIATATTSQLILEVRDLGNNVSGPTLTVGRNSSAGAVGPAPGMLNLYRANGNPTLLWVDNSANLRINSAGPTGSSGAPTVDITAGTVVGTQTSSLDAKNIVGDAISTEAALQNVMQGAEAVRRFTYKNGAFNNEEFGGLVIDYAPRYGMDCDKDHPAGKSLNVINAIGDLMLAVKEIAIRLGVESNA